MKSVPIIIYIFLTTILSVSAQSIKLESPAYLGMVLIDEPTVENMVKTCRYYNLSDVGMEDSFYVFSHGDGTKIRFKVDKSEKGNIPVVQVTSSDKAGTIKRILSDTGFVKQGDCYYKGSELAHRRTKCELSSGMGHKLSSGSNSVITLTKEYKHER